MTDSGHQIRSLDPCRDRPYVLKDAFHMSERVNSSIECENRRPRFAVGHRGPRFIVIALAVAGIATSGIAVAAASSSPSPRAALTSHLNALLDKYGRATSTTTSQADCDGTGLAFAEGFLNNTSVPTLLANFSSDVTSLDQWYFNQSVPTTAVTNALEANTDFNAITTGSTPTSVCYFLGNYGENFATPFRQFSTTKQAVLLVFVTGGKAYWPGTLQYPIATAYQTPPAAG